VAARRYIAEMEQPELAALARRYLDLWQQQLAAGGTGTAGAAAAEAASILAQVLSGDLPGKNRKGVRNGDADEAASGIAPDRAAALEPASVDGDGGDDEFARRLAECAERFAALAAGVGGGGGGTDGGTEPK